MRTLRLSLLGAALVAVSILVYRLGAGSIASALTHLKGWQFALICLVHVSNVTADACGWRYALPRDRAPFHRLVLARCAGDAVNVLTAVAAVGGEAAKAWLLRREVPYEESVPSLIISKTAEVIGQTLLLAVAIVLAATTAVVGPGLRTAMVSLLVIELICSAGLVGVQLAGMVGRFGRLFSSGGVGGTGRAERVDEVLRGYYRHDWRRFLVSVGFHFLGWLLGAVQALLILESLGLSGSIVMAVILEGLWSAVRFATFYVPASLGTLEGATVAAFRSFGFSPGAGLAFTLVRRAAQAVWVGLGLVALLAMRPAARVVTAPGQPVPSGAE